jgi:MoaA/NifB/PqqE/SkfB family radical SAM enzyme
MRASKILSVIYDCIKNYLAKRPLTISFDVTNKCNLRCEMCYWWRHRKEKELTVKQAVKLFRKFRDKHKIIQCAYCGGEPTLRPDILEACTKIIPANWVVTNGTRDMPKLGNSSSIGVSIDGTQKIHDKIRGKGVYKKAWDRYSNYTKYYTYTATTLIKRNMKEPEKLVKEWSNTSIKGMIFDFATPFRGSDNKFFIPMKQREKVVDRLIKLKKEYGKFIVPTIPILKWMKKKHVEKKAKDCILKWVTVCLDSQGNRKYPCVLGKDAICEKCGCVVSIMAQYYFKPRWSSPYIWARSLKNSLMKGAK